MRESRTIAQVGGIIRDAAKRGFRILIWIAMPCRGWSAWQRVNLSLGEETLQKVKAERAESLLMLEKLAVLLDDIRGLGCEVHSNGLAEQRDGSSRPFAVCPAATSLCDMILTVADTD